VELMETIVFGSTVPEAIFMLIASIIGSGINGNKTTKQPPITPYRDVKKSLLLLEVELMETRRMGGIPSSSTTHIYRFYYWKWN